MLVRVAVLMLLVLVVVLVLVLENQHLGTLDVKPALRVFARIRLACSCVHTSIFLGDNSIMAMDIAGLEIKELDNKFGA
jgi:hypothetical protein